MKTIQFKKGDIVQWTTRFLQSSGQYTNVPIDGKVIGLLKNFKTEEGITYPIVWWCNREKHQATLVHPANLELAPYKEGQRPS